jgi:hypothetical protein
MSARRITASMCDDMATAIRPARKKYLAFKQECLAVDAKLHAKWGWNKDSNHVKRCKACKAAEKNS